MKCYKVGESTIRGWRKQKEKIQALEEMSGKPLSRLRTRIPHWPEIEEKLATFLLQKKSEGKILTKKSIQTIAAKIARQFGIDDFKASSGWIHRFKQRNGLYD